MRGEYTVTIRYRAVCNGSPPHAWGILKQLAKDTSCYYCKANERTYNLNKFDSDIHSEMGVFAWVHKEDDDCFWISTRKIWVEEAKAKVLAG
jgi:hypothetical protein